MHGVFDFVIKPVSERYNNSKTIDNTELILNTDLQDHNFVSRVGIVMGLPINNQTGICLGDEVIVHHNVFRRYRDIRGVEKNSRSYYKDDLYFVNEMQIYAYKHIIKWIPLSGYNFVAPIKEDKMFSIDFEKPLKGI